MCLVELRGVSLEIGGRRILRDVSLEVEPGGVAALMGPNGSGKTSILRVISGIYRSIRGEARVCGSEPSRSHRHISYVPAYPSVEPSATGADVVLSYSYKAPDGVGGEAFIDRARRLLEGAGLSHLLSRRFGSMSSGEQKLLMLAGALARRPRVLVLDEPFAFLDLANQVRVARIIRLESSGGVTVVMAVHEPLHAAIAGRVFLVSGGSVVGEGSPSEVLDGRLMERIYGASLEEATVKGRKILVPDMWG